MKVKRDTFDTGQPIFQHPEDYSEDRYIIHEMKIFIILVIGCIVIMACVIYIIVQCKRKAGYAVKLCRNRKESSDVKKLIDNHESVESLLHVTSPNLSRSQINKEFYV